MKHINILLIVVLVSSCCGTKKVVENSSKEVVMIETTKAPEQQNETQEVVSPKEDSSKIEIPPPPKPPKLEDVEEGIDDYHPEGFLHYKFNKLLQTHVSDKGEVNYKGLKSDVKSLREYISSLNDNMPNAEWNDQDKLAYWINAYNAITIDLIIRNYPIKSIKDIKDPWKQRYWKLGEKWYNLDEIEHQIIRKMGEPRIHFALVCAAKSCPKLYNKAFTAFELEKDLTKLTEEFLADESKNNISQKSLRLSKIFKWFAKDFKQDGSLIDFLNTYSEVNISNKAKKSFKDYNWNLND